MLAPQQLQLYADPIHDNGAPLDSCFGFVYATVYQIARPKNNQQVYNGHERVHGLKFQNIALPNGIIGNLVGPYEGWRHDSFMLAESGLLPTYNNMLGLGTIRWVFMRILHTLLVFIYKHQFRGANLTDEQKCYSKAMSSVRVSVEWLFGLVKNYFKFIDFKQI